MGPPPQQRRGVHTRWAERGVGGSIFWKTRDIGLPSYSNNLSKPITLAPRPPHRVSPLLPPSPPKPSSKPSRPALPPAPLFLAPCTSLTGQEFTVVTEVNILLSNPSPLRFAPRSVSCCPPSPGGQLRGGPPNPHPDNGGQQICRCVDILHSWAD